MHPFKFIDSKYYFRMVFINLIITFLVMAGMQWSEFGMQNDVATKGIISLELAGDIDTAQAIISSWRAGHQMGYAGFNIGLDYFFLILYSSLIGLVIILISNGFSEKNIIRKAGYFISWLVVAAAFFDAIENVALINLLTDSIESYWVTIAYYCAVIKFSGVVLGILFILVGGLAHGVQRALKGV